MKLKKLTILFTLIFFASLMGFITSAILTSGFSTDTYFNIVPGGFKGGDKTMNFTEDYSNIDLRTSSAKVIIKPSEDNVTRLEYIGNNNTSTIEAEVVNGVLAIREKWALSFMNWSIKNSSLIIELPDFAYDEISMKISSGSITTENLAIDCQKLTVGISSGKINVDGISNNEYSIRCSSGSVKLNNISGKGDVQVSSGSITVNYAEWNDSLKVRASSGSVKFHLPAGSGLKVDSKVSSGNVKYELGGNSGKIGDTNGAKFGGENIQNVNISVSSGNISFLELK